MNNTYELIRKYGKYASSQGIELGEGARLVVMTKYGTLATVEGADLMNLTLEDIDLSDLPEIPDPYQAMVISRSPYCMQVLGRDEAFAASLDDMAMITGPECRIYKKFPKKLKEGAAFFMADGYTVTVGDTLLDAITALTILEKAAEVDILAESIGGTIPLKKREARKLRTFYASRYGKSKGKVKKARKAAAPSEFEMILREELAEYGRKIIACGLVQGTWGNLSARLDEDYMLVTPSGVSYSSITAEDIVKVKIKNLKYEGEHKPTTEAPLHAAIYMERGDVRAIIHTHSRYASVFAATENDMNEEVCIGEYGSPGSKKLMRETVSALGVSYGCIMSHHGMLAAGTRLEDAFSNATHIEAEGENILI